MRRMASSSSSMWTTNKRFQRVSMPIMASRASSFRLASTTFRKGSKKASAACSNVIPSWCPGFSRALFSSQMNVIPCKTKRVSMVSILAERYIQRQYRETRGSLGFPRQSMGLLQQLRPNATLQARRSARSSHHVSLPLVCPARLLDDLVRAEQERRGYRDPERLG